MNQTMKLAEVFEEVINEKLNGLEVDNIQGLEEFVNDKISNIDADDIPGIDDYVGRMVDDAVSDKVGSIEAGDVRGLDDFVDESIVNSDLANSVEDLTKSVDDHQNRLLAVESYIEELHDAKKDTDAIMMTPAIKSMIEAEVRRALVNVLSSMFNGLLPPVATPVKE